MHIVVAGNIGSGKTTLTGMLAKQFSWEAAYETVENNPYLTSFYQDMQRWSFNLQVYFLNKRFRKILELRKKKKSVIQDRTIYEDAYIFSKNLYDMGLMATRDYENYTSLFELVTQFIDYPDLLIYLRADTPTLVSQIQKRGREYESSIRIDYLENLNKHYEEWIKRYEEEVVKEGKGKLLVIDVSQIKFGENPEDFGTVYNMVNAELFGLF